MITKSRLIEIVANMPVDEVCIIARSCLPIVANKQRHLTFQPGISPADAAQSSTLAQPEGYGAR